MSAFARLVIREPEAQGRGFAHGHEKNHIEPRVKASVIIQLLLGCSGSGDVQPGHSKEDILNVWMDALRRACLSDAATKQFASAVESARQFGCTEQREVFTAEEKSAAD